MKYYPLAIGLLAFLHSCGPVQNTADRVMGIPDGFVENQSAQKLDELIIKIDKKRASKTLKKVQAKEQSICAGTVEAYYLDSTLVYTSSRIEHELKAYSTRDVYWSQDEILKIVYREYLPDWQAHQEKYPPNIYGAKLEKMIYGDTLYEITFGPEGHFHQRSAGKLLSNSVDRNLLLKLVECAHSIKSQLSRESNDESQVISYSFNGLESYGDTLPFREEYTLQVKVGDVAPSLLNCTLSSTASSRNKIVEDAPGEYTLRFEAPGTYKLYLDLRTEGSWKHIDTKVLHILRPE